MRQPDRLELKKAIASRLAVGMSKDQGIERSRSTLMPSKRLLSNSMIECLTCIERAIGSFRKKSDAKQMKWRAGIQKLSVWPPARQVHAILTRVPLVGSALKKLTRRAIPRETRVWVDIRAGLGKGLALHLDPRFEMDYASGEIRSAPSESAIGASASGLRCV